MQKLLIIGLGLAFIGFLVGSTSKHSSVAGFIFIAVVILGVIGIIKMRKYN